MMKKIIVLCFLVFLASCNNPFDKYKDSVDKLKEALEASKAIEKEVADIQAKLNALKAENKTSYTAGDIIEIYSSLQIIESNLNNQIVQSILQNYKEQNSNVDLDTKIKELQTNANAYNYAGTNPSKDEVTTLFTSLVTKIQNLQ